MKERLSELQSLCDQATPGPWKVKENVHRETSGELWGWIDGPSNRWTWSNKYKKDRVNAAFIAAARTALPELIAENAKIRAKIDAAEVYIEELEDYLNIPDAVTSSPLKAAEQKWEALK